MGSNVVAGGGAVAVTYAVEICPLNSGKGLNPDVAGRGEATEREATEDEEAERKDEEAEENKDDSADEDDEGRDGDGLIDEAPSTQVS